MSAAGRALGAAAGIGADAWLGEPPAKWHPVAAFGATMTAVEQRLYRDTRAAGAAHLAVGLGLAAFVAYGARRVLGPGVAAAVAVAVASAGKMLDDEAAGIAAHLSAADLPSARTALRSLVGRTPDDLDASEIARAVIESVAENSVDAVVSSLCWGAVAGAPGALMHRASNTLDAMVGHRNARYEHFGWASARFDDVLNFVPARLAVAAVCACRPHAAGSVWRTVRRDSAKHPSPNGGVIEAAYAAALGVQLGGVNHYGGEVEDRGTLGDGTPPDASAIHAAIRLRRHTTAALALAVAALGMCGRVVRSVHRR